MIAVLRGAFAAWRRRARQLRTEAHALYLAYGDPRVPWYARAFAAGVVAYAFSPLDVVPDFIPVLGYLDDLVLLPLGFALAMRMILRNVLEECRAKAQVAVDQGQRVNWIAAGAVIALWLALAALGIMLALRVFGTLKA